MPDWQGLLVNSVRTTGSVAAGGSSNTTVRTADLQVHLGRLESQLTFLPISPPETQRRRRLVQHLLQQQQQQQGNLQYLTSNSRLSPTLMQQQQSQQQSQSTMSMAMRQQDDLLDELAIGVGRLRDQTQLIGEEAKMHVNLLGDMEDNLHHARDGLEAETKRAARIKEDQSVWRLQLTVAGLGVLMILLILAGLN